MTGPLAQQIAQVRDFIGEPTCWIRALDEGEDPNAPNPAQVEAENALAALSAIERHVQDMERLSVENAAYSALHSAVERADAHGNLADLWDVEDALTACNAKLAALPAREKGEE